MRFKVKKILVILLLSISNCVGCGFANQACQENYSKMTYFCDKVMGFDTDLVENPWEIKKSFFDLKYEITLLTMLCEKWEAMAFWHLTQVDEAFVGAIRLVMIPTNDMYLVNNQLELISNNLATDVSVLDGLEKQLIEAQVAFTERVTHLHVESIIDFCGNVPGVRDDIGLFLSNGEIVQVMSEEDNVWLVSLKKGNYKTIDGSKCHFSINVSGKVTNQRMVR